MFASLLSERSNGNLNDQLATRLQTNHRNNEHIFKLMKYKYLNKLLVKNIFMDY